MKNLYEAKDAKQSIKCLPKQFHINSPDYCTIPYHPYHTLTSFSSPSTSFSKRRTTFDNDTESFNNNMNNKKLRETAASVGSEGEILPDDESIQRSASTSMDGGDVSGSMSNVNTGMGMSMDNVDGSTTTSSNVVRPLTGYAALANLVRILFFRLNLIGLLGLETNHSYTTLQFFIVRFLPPPAGPNGHGCQASNPRYQCYQCYQWFEQYECYEC